MPVLPDAVSKGKIENFEWNLREEHFEKVLESIQKIYLPTAFDRMNARTFMEEWIKKAVVS